MDFVETVTLVVPQIDRSVFEFGESDLAEHGLIIETAAIHVGVTSNFNHYGEEALEASLDSWVNPYPKPILLNHDPHVDPVGRVMAAKMDHESDGTPYTRLQIAITDPAAIEKILTKRYLTGSVGGKALEATCSICNTDWTKASASAGLPCKHRRGTAYKGQLAVLDMKNVAFKEYSFVNVPADGRSGVRSKGEVTPSEESDGWVRPLRLFGLNMAKEEVVEYTESESRDLLAPLRKKESAPLYLSLKGAFLSALAAQETDTTEEEDILAVSETLSEELANVNEDGPEEDKTDEDTTHLHLRHKKKHDIYVEVGYNRVDDDDDDGKGDDDDDAPAASAPAAPASAADEEPLLDESEANAEDAEEAEISSDLQNKDDLLNVDSRTRRAEGQEKPKARDVDPETSKGAPRSREEDDTDEVTEGEEETVETETDRELDERIKALESTLADTQSKTDSLLAENARLKAALKRNMAERVVDTKITLAMVERDQREDQLNEHMNRSAASLADSLRDLAGMRAPVRPDYTKFPTTEEDGSGAVEDPAEKGITQTEGLNGLQEELEPPQAEDFLVDVLMGRRKI